MQDILKEIVVYMWRRKYMRMHLLNITFVCLGALGLYLYVNYMHAEAMAEIEDSQTSLSEIKEDTSHISDRVDELYRALILSNPRHRQMQR